MSSWPLPPTVVCVERDSLTTIGAVGIRRAMVLCIRSESGRLDVGEVFTTEVIVKRRGVGLQEFRTYVCDITSAPRHEGIIYASVLQSILTYISQMTVQNEQVSVHILLCKVHSLLIMHSSNHLAQALYYVFISRLAKIRSSFAIINT